MRAPLAIALKDLRLLARDRTGAFFVFVFPLALSLFFGSIFGSGARNGALTVAFCREGDGPLAKAFASDLSGEAALKLVPVASREQGAQMVRNGTAAAMVALPADFDAGVSRMLAAGGAHIDLLADPRRGAEAGLLQGLLMKVGFQCVARAFQDPAVSARMLSQARLALTAMSAVPSERQASMREMLDAADAMQRALRRTRAAEADGADPAGEGLGRLVQVREIEFTREGEPPANAFAITFPQGVAWGFMGLVGAFGASLAEERRRGTMLRLLTAPVGRLGVLGGKALGCFLGGLLVTALLTATATLALGVHVQRWDLLAAAAVASAFAFSGLAVGMAGFFRHEGSARSAGNAVVLVLAMVGGGTIPLAFMPEFLRMASKASPFSWSILAIEGAVWRGFGAAEMAVPLGVLTALGLAGLLFARSAMRPGEA